MDDSLCTDRSNKYPFNPTMNSMDSDCVPDGARNQSDSPVPPEPFAVICCPEDEGQPQWDHDGISPETDSIFLHSICGHMVHSEIIIDVPCGLTL